MRKRGKIPCLGQIVEKDTGRPTFVYGPYDPGRRMYRHELLLTDAVWHIPPEQVKRWKDVNQEVGADAEHESGGHHFFWELDSGELTHSQVIRRWHAYREINESMSAFLLFVTATATERRMDGLREKAKRYVGNIALFTTLPQIIDKTPYSEIWIDCLGRKVALPRNG